MARRIRERESYHIDQGRLLVLKKVIEADTRIPIADRRFASQSLANLLMILAKVDVMPMILDESEKDE